MSVINFIKDLFDFSEFEKVSDEALGYKIPPSLSRQFSWEGFDTDTGFFELNTGKSVAAIYELFPIPTEGQPKAYLDQIAESLSRLFTDDCFRQYYQKESPWTVQFFVSDDYDLSEDVALLKSGINRRAAGTQFSQRYFEMVDTHYDYLSKSGGVFKDPLSDIDFKGRVRRIRMVVYRRLHSKSEISKRSTPVSDLKGVCNKVEEQLKSSGVRFKKCCESDFYRWMFKWFSPKPKGFKDSDDYLNSVPFPESDDEKPYGFDLTQSVFSSLPESDAQTGIWYFDGIPHRYIPIVGFNKLPQSGHISAERSMVESENNRKIYAPMDKLPEGAVFTMTIVLQTQEFQKRYNEKIEKKSKKTKDYDAQLAGHEAEMANAMIAHGNSIFPVCMGVYIKAATQESLMDIEDNVVSVITQTMNLKVLSNDKDVRQLDRYIRHLPMNYSFTYDKKYLLQSRLATLKQAASTLPIYGRSRGTGSPLFSFSNRLGEPLFFDPFKDKISNAHMLILGTTGSGKSNLSSYLISQLIAMKLPRMVIIDAGGSFRYFIGFAKSLGVNINVINITMDRPNYTLNPFTETKKMLAQVKSLDDLNKKLSEYESELNKRIEGVKKQATEAELNANPEKENRDYLMEFVTAAILMITGAEPKEIDNLDRQDRYLIIEAIKKSAQSAVDSGFDQMIPSDLADTLEVMATESSSSDSDVDRTLAIKLSRMSHGIRSFINMPLNAMYFNQRGEALPEADITYFEMGLFKDDRLENEAPKALAFIKLMNDSMTKAEKYRDDGRDFIFYADECHTVTSKSITSASIVQATKMGRKVSLWIWLATQNVRDFPKSAAKAVSMLEYKLILWSDLKERSHINDFIDLTPNQSATLNSLTKVKGRYVEGMLLSNEQNFLFRNVPPREILTLSATDGDEHDLRKELMKEYDCDGVIASLLMAQKFRGEDYDLAKAQAVMHEKM